jgi:hypothetical protein
VDGCVRPYSKDTYTHGAQSPSVHVLAHTYTSCMFMYMCMYAFSMFMYICKYIHTHTHT